MNDVQASITLSDGGILTWHVNGNTDKDNPNVVALWGVYILMLTRADELGSMLANLSEEELDAVTKMDITVN